jgi:hypothetical protein
MNTYIILRLEYWFFEEFDEIEKNTNSKRKTFVRSLSEEEK